MLKVIIAIDNDILYNSLSQIALQSKEKIEVTKESPDKLHSIICKNKRENLIILDSFTSVTFCLNILKNLNINKQNVIILVIDSNSMSNIYNSKFHFPRNSNYDSSLIDIVKLVSDSLKVSLELEQNIDQILWKIGLTSYTKGTTYIKDAILLSYNNRRLLLETRMLIKHVATKNNIENDKVVRSDMDRALNNAIDLINTDTIYNIFGDDYDGRKISLRYFIDLCIRFLEKQRYSCIKN